MVMETLGQRVARLRKDKGFRFQSHFARAIGIDPTSLNQIEQGYRIPKLPTVDKMATALGVTRDVILDGESKAAQPTPPPAAPKHQQTTMKDNSARVATSSPSPHFELSDTFRRDLTAAVHAAVFDVFADIVEILGGSIVGRAEARHSRKNRPAAHGAASRNASR